jgi:hypothetical protein
MFFGIMWKLGNNISAGPVVPTALYMADGLRHYAKICVEVIQ